MYEIWLAMNIAFEIAWGLWPALLPLALVWAAVTVSAVTGSVAYALLAAWERRAAFWHPSIRGKK